MRKTLLLVFAISISNYNQEIKAQSTKDEIIVHLVNFKLMESMVPKHIHKCDIQNSTSESIVDLITKFPGIKTI